MSFMGTNLIASMGSKNANMLLALAHFAMAGAVATTLDDGANNIQNPTIFVVSPKGGTDLINIDVKWLIVTFTIITGLFHLLYAYRGYAGKLRYLEYAITASMMITIIQLLSRRKKI